MTQATKLILIFSTVVPLALFDHYRAGLIGLAIGTAFALYAEVR